MDRVVKKCCRGKGRPRKFDEDEALGRAMCVFWDHGFAATSIDDLVDGMGIGRASLYATFGDKETLFARCLERYSRRGAEALARALSAETTACGAVGAVLRLSVLNATEPDGPRGCLLLCVAPVAEASGTREFVEAAMSAAQQQIEERLAAAMAAGDLPAGFPAATRARMVVDFAAALALRARVGEPREDLLGYADSAARALCAGP